MIMVGVQLLWWDMVANVGYDCYSGICCYGGGMVAMMEYGCDDVVCLLQWG